MYWLQEQPILDASAEYTPPLLTPLAGERIRWVYEIAIVNLHTS